MKSHPSTRAARLVDRPAGEGGRLAWSGARAVAALIVAGLVCAEPTGAGGEAGALAGADPTAVVDAAAFVDSLGVNTHLSWPGTPYVDRKWVMAKLAYLGIRRVRDDFALNPAGLAAVGELMARGFRFDLISGSPPQPFVSAVRRLRQAHPDGLIAVEGPNEVDSWRLSYAGRSGFQAAIRDQQDLFGSVRAEPVLRGVPVYNLSVAAVEATRALGDLSPYADFANVHLYYGGGQPAYGWSPGDGRYHWASWLDSARRAAKGRPVVVTETGSSVTPSWGGGVDEATQARQILNSLMDAARTRVSGVYIYELVDGMNNGPDDPKSHYGLFRWDRSARPAAEAIHNLVLILRRGSGLPRADTDGALAYSIEGVPQWGGHLLFRRGDGTQAIAVWAEPDIWNESLRRPIAPPVARSTLRLSRPSRIAVYDPLVGAEPVRSAAAATEVSLSLTDRPLIVEVQPLR